MSEYMYMNLYISLHIFIFTKNHIMQVTTYTDFRQRLKSYLDKVRDNHTPLYVTSANGEDVVVISKSDYESMEETFYLLRSPANATRLLQSIDDYKNGLGKERNLIEE
jgi:antitoxin YefM